MKQNIWMKVTNDKYALPVAVADSAKELAAICHTTDKAICSAISHAKKRGGKSLYVKTEIEI